MDGIPMGIYKGYSCGLEEMPWGVGSGDRIFPAGEAGPGQATAHKGSICIKNPVRDHPHANWIFNPLGSLSLRRRDFPGSRQTFNDGRAGVGHASRLRHFVGNYAFSRFLFARSCSIEKNAYEYSRRIHA